MEKKKSTKKHSSEYRRGYRAGKKEMTKYRSFKTVDGKLFGYTRSGSLRQFSKPNITRGFYGGWDKAVREAVKAKPTKTRTKKSSDIIHAKPRKKRPPFFSSPKTRFQRSPFQRKK